MIAIAGMLLLDGRPAAGQRVLLLSSDMRQLIAATETDDAGRYTLEGSGVIVAKIRSPVIAMQVSPSTRPDFHFETQKLCSLHIDIVPVPGVQANDIDISITPAHLDDIPASVEAFFLRREERVVDSAYFETRTSARSIDVAVQRGTYRIYASRIDYGRPESTVPLPPNLKAETVTIAVDHDQSVRVQLAVLPDEALLR
jgi:hypothetical protein